MKIAITKCKSFCRLPEDHWPISKYFMKNFAPLSSVSLYRVFLNGVVNWSSMVGGRIMKMFSKFAITQQLVCAVPSPHEIIHTLLLHGQSYMCMCIDSVWHCMITMCVYAPRVVTLLRHGNWSVLPPARSYEVMWKHYTVYSLINAPRALIFFKRETSMEVKFSV